MLGSCDTIMIERYPVISERKADMMIICPVCGKETEGGYKFCMNCRSEIGGVGVAQAAETVQAAATQATSADPGSIAQAAAAGVSAAAATAAPKITAAPGKQAGEVPGAQIGAVPGAQVDAAPGASQAMPAQNYESYEPYIQQGTIPDYSQNPNMYAAPDPNIVRVTKKKGMGGGRKAFAFFLCIFLFFSILVTLALYCVRKSLSVENLTSAVVNADAIGTMDIGELTGREEDKGKTISQMILDNIPEDQKESFPELTEDKINEFLNDEAAQDIISGPLEDLVDYLSGEKEEFSIDSEKVVKSLEEHADAVEKYTGKKLETSDYDSIKKSIDEFNEENLGELPGGSNSIKDSGVATTMKALKLFFSDELFYIALGITFFFILMVFVICGRYVDSAMLRVGLTSAVVGGIVFGGIKVGRVAIEKTAEKKVGKGVMEMLDKAVFNNFEQTGQLVLWAGVGTFVIGILWRILFRKKTTA